MNPYDEYGVEEALRMKEKFGGEVTIVCVGPARTMETIRTALAMGAEKGIQIDDPASMVPMPMPRQPPWRLPLKGFPMTSSSAASGPLMMTPVRSVPSWRNCWNSFRHLCNKTGDRWSEGKSRSAHRRRPVGDWKPHCPA